jgi:hypothetical protein
LRLPQTGRPRELQQDWRGNVNAADGTDVQLFLLAWFYLQSLRLMGSRDFAPVSGVSRLRWDLIGLNRHFPYFRKTPGVDQHERNNF